jgi:hypothetical protein
MKLIVFILAVTSIGCGSQNMATTGMIYPTGLSSIIKHGLLQTAGGESALVSFNNQAIDLSFNHNPQQVAVINVLSQQLESAVQTPNLDLGGALIINGVVNVFQSYSPNVSQGFAPQNGYITRMTSKDLVSWTAPIVMIQLTNNQTCDNVTMIQDSTGYLLACDTQDIGGWSIKFYHSPDMNAWTQVGGYFSDGNIGYASTPALVYQNGYYYMFFTANPIGGVLYNNVQVARSTDLIIWEVSKQIVLAPTAGEGISDCNMTLTEVNGVVYMAYSIGDQQTWGNLNWATFNGTIVQFIAMFF